MIDYSLILPLILFAFSSTGTPGPNNIMLLASGANFGYLRSVPHMVGIWAGLASMMIIMSMGLSQIFDVYPVAKTVLKVLATGYMLWLAVKIVRAAPVKETDAPGRPMTPLQAALFQWVNPKAWAMSAGAVTLYAIGTGWIAIAGLVVIFVIVSLITNSTWIVLGKQVTRFLSTPLRLRTFNVVMAVLLVASLYPVLIE
ncbi:LysE family translocator [Parasulfitobacter algicola]|uniref:LysE family translocator n=1 Tax=Parasulfitobacter algicola TaxID=2614809 RepID=A0ABX2IT40_9RHOB|nr:LysE family translocator [Sulfitobacter algicola]NSX54250.1 LysE family translocator [Sulfitobacter algicola]